MIHRGQDGERQRTLLRIVRDVRRRWRLKLLLRGGAITGGAALAVFLLSSWVLERAGFTPGALLAVRVLAYGAVALLAVRYLLRPLLQRVSDERAALYLEEHEPGLHELVLSALELERTGPLHPLARRTVERALEQCRTLDDGRVFERADIRRFGSALGAVAVVALFLGAIQPALLRQGAGALLNPLRDLGESSPYSIEVAPGTITIPRGADQAVSAALRGFDAADAELVLRSGPDSSFQRIPMLSGQDSAVYEALLFDIEQPLEYFVEAGGVRSAVYRIEVVDLPYVQTLALEYRYPAYTGLPPDRVEDGGDVAALRGTMVHVFATTTVPAAGGSIVLSTGGRIPLVRDSAGLWTGAFRVEQQGFYHIELEAAAGDTVNGSPEFTIDVLADRAPGIRFSKPGRDTRPTIIDEVYLETQAEDDYGVRSIELFYSVNGGAEQRQELYRGTQSLTEVTAGHTLYLEELSLQPGDVVSYYARTRDHAGSPPVTSDIYFLTMRPFGREYRQADSGPGQGGGQQGENPGELTQQQREIIAATFNLVRDSAQYTASAYREYLNTIALMQERLREQVSTLAQRMRNRQVTADTMFARIAEILPQASAAMDSALRQLRGPGARPALPPEQRALQQLERAEALYREVQVQMQQGGGGSGSQGSSAEDLADLFELELDKLRNQYETVQRGEREQSQQQVDATLEQLRELARRLQQENERMRRQALQGQQGGSGGGNQREMAEELEQAARQLQRLSRDQPQQQELERAARELEQAANALRRSAAEARNGSTAQGQQALDRLREATRRLEQERGSGMEREARDALRRAERLAEQQRETSERMERAAGAGASAQELQELIERRTQQLGETGLLEQQLDGLAAGTRREQREASRRLQQAADAIRESNLKEMQSFSRNLVRDRASPDMVRQFGERIEQAMDSVLGELRGAVGSFSQSDEQRTAEAVRRAGELARGLESMRERTTGARTGAERTNRGDGTEGTSSADEGPGRPGGGGGRVRPGGADGGGFSGEQVRQLRSEVRQRIAEAEALRRELRAQGQDASGLDGVLEGLRQLEREGTYANAEQLSKIQGDVAEDMKVFEFALRRALLGGERDQLHLSGGDQVPEAYRALVEEYYRRLSRRQ